MSRTILCILILFPSSVISMGLEDLPVTELTDKNFRDYISNGYTLIAFCEFWHKDCNNLYTKYDEVGRRVRELELAISIARIDCRRAGVFTCKKYGIHSYPSIKLFKDGIQIDEYLGKRNAKDVIKYMVKIFKVGPHRLNDLESYLKFLEEPYFGLIGYFLNDTKLKTRFLEMCEIHENKYRCGIITEHRVLNNITLSNHVVLRRPMHLNNPYEEDFNIYDPEIHSIDLLDFIEENLHGLVGHRTPENHRDFKPPLITIYYKVDFKINRKLTNYFRHRIFPIAREFKGRVRFAVGDLSEHKEIIFQTVQINFNPFNTKFLVLAVDALGRKYRMNQEFSSENLQQFVMLFLKGNLEPYVKSQPIPYDDEINSVENIVGVNFEEKIFKNTFDTIIFFYELGDSKTDDLINIFQHFGEKIRGDRIFVAKMNSERNHAPEIFNLKETPMAFWLAKHNKNKPIKVHPFRKIDDWIKFVSRMASRELIGFRRNGTIKAKSKILYNRWI